MKNSSETEGSRKTSYQQNSKQVVDQIPSDEEIDLMDQRRREEEVEQPQKGKRQSQKSSLVPTFLYSSLSFSFLFSLFIPFFFPGITAIFGAEWQIIWSKSLIFCMQTWKLIEIVINIELHQLESKSVSERWLLILSPLPFQQHNMALFYKIKSYNRPER